MFDFGAPVGFRIAARHPERIQALVLQNGNAYEAGLGPGMQALKPYWHDRPANEEAIRGLLRLEVTRSQYVDGGQPRSLGARPALPRAPGRDWTCSTTTGATSSSTRRTTG